MNWLLLIRGLQVLSALFALLGGGNAAAMAGKSFEGTGFDWMATIAPMLAAAGSWAASQFLGWKLTTPTLTELAAAIIAYGRDRSEEHKMRLLVAIIAVVKELVGSLESLVKLSEAMDGVAVASSQLTKKA